jgi:pyocin large subunit-like protein
MPRLFFERGNWLASPYINRFLSADTIVPGYANPQSLNRYSYVTNNPLRYTDPTGHMMVEDEGSTKGGLDCHKYPQYCNNGKKNVVDPRIWMDISG